MDPESMRILPGTLAKRTVRQKFDLHHRIHGCPRGALAERQGSWPANQPWEEEADCRGRKEGPSRDDQGLARALVLSDV